MDYYTSMLQGTDHKLAWCVDTWFTLGSLNRTGNSRLRPVSISFMCSDTCTTLDRSNITYTSPQIRDDWLVQL